MSAHDEAVKAVKELFEQVSADLATKLERLTPFLALKPDDEHEELLVVIQQKAQVKGNDFKELVEVLVQGYGGEYVNVEPPAKPFFRIKPKPKPVPEPQKQEAVEQKKKELEQMTPGELNKVCPEEPSPVPDTLAKAELCVSPVTSFFGTYCVQCQDYTPKKAIDEAVKNGDTLPQMICPGMQHAGDTGSNYAKICVEVLKFGVLDKTRARLEDIARQLENLNRTGIPHDVAQHSTTQHNATQQSTAQQPKPVSAPAKTLTVENVRMLFPEYLETMLNFEDEGDYIKISPKQFLGSENFAKAASVVRQNGGEYISAGKDSHFRHYKKAEHRPSGEAQDYQRETAGKAKAAAQDIQDFTDEFGRIWRRTKKKDADEYYWKATPAENDQNQAFLDLRAAIDNQEKAAIYADHKFRWTMDDGSIGMKPQKPKAESRRY